MEQVLSLENVHYTLPIHLKQSRCISKKTIHEHLPDKNDDITMAQEISFISYQIQCQILQSVVVVVVFSFTVSFWSYMSIS